ncbi:hypothetical protein ACIQ6Y_12225 [Streptomyces sp. NPDC096205]|uniref:hypothetical protein n=1 Tax=Streptomyces sp. NPDC096205 TaxID=3366081 RepID=UPI00382983BC
MRRMRPSSPPALRLAAAGAAAAAAAGLLGVPAPAQAVEAGPACAAQEGRAFPLTTRIHGGPETYEPGGAPGVWSLVLTNTTDRICTGIHPVVVLTDEERALRPGQPRLDFYAGGRPHRVRFEATDEDELVGAFADDAAKFPGFSVGPGRTLTVKVRFALAEGTVPNEVTATAAVVQRRDDDGDWVGHSNDYRFTIGTDPDATDSTEPTDSGSTDPTGPTDPADPSPPADPRSDRLPSVGELARTGPTALPAALATAALLLAAGAALRHRRNGR